MRFSALSSSSEFSIISVLLFAVATFSTTTFAAPVKSATQPSSGSTLAVPPQSGRNGVPWRKETDPQRAAHPHLDLETDVMNYAPKDSSHQKGNGQAH